MKFTVLATLMSTATALTPLWEFSDPSHDIKLVNDPVMGGLSASNYTVVDNTVLSWTGGVEVVPSLSAPGFCNLESSNGLFEKFPDASGAQNIALLVKSDTMDYKGFKFSFAGDTWNPQFKSYKTDFFVTEDLEKNEAGYYKVVMPLNQFSNNWSSYTGEAIVKCEDDASVCPSDKALKRITQVGLWAEGVEGHFQLDVFGVYHDADEVKQATTVKDSICTVQSTLKFDIDDTAASVGLPNAGDESLAQAVCCDTAFSGFPEPRYFYQTKNLFVNMDKSGLNTFYDSACGLPVFQAPMGRSFKEWQADTSEHGWPSFRGDEIISANVDIRENGDVYSKCGSKLGTMENENDGTGDRACIDLVCIAGSAAE